MRSIVIRPAARDSLTIQEFGRRARLRRVRDFFFPLDGLTVPRTWDVGPVRFLTPATARALIERHAGALIKHPLSRDGAAEFATTLETATAQVTANSSESALDLTMTAVDILRVFQQSRTAWVTTMFGLPGDVLNARVPHIALGTDTMVGLIHRGQLPGWTFGVEEHDAFLASPGFMFAASAIGRERKSEAERRALLGIQLASQAILEHRPAMQLVYSVMSAETLLLERMSSSQAYRLARRCVIFLCGLSTNDLCGRQRDTCLFLSIDPDTNQGRKDLRRLRERGNQDPLWRCSEWHRVMDWYSDRSDIVHGAQIEVDDRQAGKVRYWLLKRVIPETLDWLQAHPNQPLADLDDAIEALPSPPDWEQVIGWPTPE